MVKSFLMRDSLESKNDNCSLIAFQPNAILKQNIVASGFGDDPREEEFDRTKTARYRLVKCSKL